MQTPDCFYSDDALKESDDEEIEKRKRATQNGRRQSVAMQVRLKFESLFRSYASTT